MYYFQFPGHLGGHILSSNTNLVCAVFSCVQTMVILIDCQCFRFAQVFMSAILHEGCTITVRESALKVDSGEKKIPSLLRGLEPASASCGT